MEHCGVDDKETANRRARLRELIRVCFNDTPADLLRHIKETTGKSANQGEMSAIQKENSGKSFGDKKARTLVGQIGLSRRWFDMPLGSNLPKSQWLADAILPTNAPNGHAAPYAPSAPPKPHTANESPAGVISLPRQQANHPAIVAVIKLMTGMDDVGKGRVLERATVIAEQHAKANPASLSQ